MKRIFFILISALLITTPAFANKASDAEIRQVLILMHAKEAWQQVRSQTTDALIARMDASSFDDFNFDEETRTDNHISMAMYTSNLVDEELSWDKIEPIYIKIYKENYTDDEIKAMLKYLSSPAGQSITKKTPIIMNAISIYIDRNMAILFSKIQTKMLEVKKKELKNPPVRKN